MKKVLMIVVLMVLASSIVGCSSLEEPQEKPLKEEKQEEPTITRNEVIQICTNILNQKDVLLQNVQLQPKTVERAIQIMSRIPTGDLKSNDPVWLMAVEIETAGINLNMYLETGDSKYYMKGTQALNRAEQYHKKYVQKNIKKVE